MSGIKGKGLKEYIFEGIMIFLAVSMGFIADNIREQKSEDSQARIFATSMINDLEMDTLVLGNYVKYMEYAKGNVDTLLQLMSNYDPSEVSTGKLYWYGLWGGAHFQFIPSDATFQQMKSSGSLRYIRDNDLLEKIVAYDQLCRREKLENEMDRSLYVEVRRSRGSIFEYRYNMQANEVYQKNKKEFSRQRIDSFIQTNPPVLTLDKLVFNQYLELVRSRNLGGKLSDAKSLLENATALIGALREAYHIEQEK